MLVHGRQSVPPLSLASNVRIHFSRFAVSLEMKTLMKAQTATAASAFRRVFGEADGHGLEMTIRTDDGRFEALYRKYFARVYRYFNRSCGVSDDESQDLAQETFKRIYENFNQYRGEAEWGFIQITAKRVLLNWLRSARTAKRWAQLVDIDDPELALDPAAANEPDFIERQDRDARIRCLLDAIVELPERQRECFRLSVVGFKYNEIAKILKVTEDAVKSRVRDAKRQLRSRLGVKA